MIRKLTLGTLTAALVSLGAAAPLYAKPPGQGQEGKPPAGQQQERPQSAEKEKMTREERRAAIAGPVGVGGAEISPVLLTRLVNDVGDNPDQLSILQHALNRTWANWQSVGSGKTPLSLTDYEAIGTMAHALDRHAEKAYAELATPRQQQICEKLFKALTDKATDPRGIRRPTALGTLCALTDATAAEVTQVMDVFRKPSRSFLMPPAGEALEAKTMIDISHESLMRVWQRLNTWANEEARSAWNYRRLAESAVLHAEGNASLLQGPDLQLALHWRGKQQPTMAWARCYGGDFAQAMDFLDDSNAQAQSNEATRSRRKRISRTVVVAAFLVMVPITLNWALELISQVRAETSKLQQIQFDLALPKKLQQLGPERTATKEPIGCTQWGNDNKTKKKILVPQIAASETGRWSSYVELLAEYCDPAPDNPDLKPFLEIVNLLRDGDIGKAHDKIVALPPEKNKDSSEAPSKYAKSALTLMDKIGTMDSEDIRSERSKLHKLYELQKSAKKPPEVKSEEYIHPVHRAIAKKLQEGKPLTELEGYLLWAYNPKVSWKVFRRLDIPRTEAYWVYDAMVEISEKPESTLANL
ncbi:MAG: hypothetical protein JJE42_18370, partial [Burkholderiales bacterium]|nr:hypothetical protein [Burkholderiales bacterium]